MKTLRVQQGSAEWHAARANCLTASEAPAMMGASKYQTRNDLLRAKHSGITPEVTAEKQRLFDQGHAAEERARPLVEAMIGDALYPATGTDDTGRLLASFDGITLDDTTIFEHKLWSASLADQVRAKELAPHYYWQLEQQLLISGADRCIFVTSDGTAERFESMEYTPQPGRAQQLLAGWIQFESDLANYVPEASATAVAGRAPETLPALRIEVTGMVTHSNLAEFKSNAMDVLGAINTSLTTDEHFADAEKTVRWCKVVEERLEAAKQQALSQTASIEELFRTIDEISAVTRSKRLELDKLVTKRKAEVRAEIATKGKNEIDAHVAKLNERIHPVRLPAPVYSISEAIKGKRTVDSLHSAVDDEVARVKIATNAQADLIDANLRAIREKAPDHQFLFADLQTLALKPADDLVTLIAARVAQHQEQQRQREEADRERIRQEERTRLENEQRATTAAPAPAVAAPIAESAPAAPVGRSYRTPVAAKPSAKPSDHEILDVLVRHYSVSRATVVEWLQTIDLAKAA